MGFADTLTGRKTGLLGMDRKIKADLSLMFCSLIWGVSFVVVKNALDHASVFIFLAVRFTVAAGLMALLRPRVLARIDRYEIFAGMRLAFFMFAGYAFQTTGLQYTTASNSGFVTGSSVVLVPVLLGVFWGRRLTAWMYAGAFGVGTQPDSGCGLRGDGLGDDRNGRRDPLATGALRVGLGIVGGDYDLRGICYGGGVHRAVVGAAVYIGESRGDSVRAGAGVCGDYVVRGAVRAAERAWMEGRGDGCRRNSNCGVDGRAGSSGIARANLRRQDLF